MPISADFLVVFVLFEILELFEYLITKYSIFEVELFLLELETLPMTLNFVFDKFQLSKDCKKSPKSKISKWLLLELPESLKLSG